MVVEIVIVGISISLAIFTASVVKRKKFTGIKDNAEFYQLRKEEDSDCRSYTGHSY